MRSAPLLLALAALCASAQDVTVSWSVPFGDLAVTEGPFGQGFSLPGSSSLAHPGEPALPALPLYVALPPGTRAVSATLDAFVEIPLEGTYEIRPMQRGVPVSRPWEFVYTPPDLRAWRNPVERPVIELTGTGVILVICFIFRNMPVGVRAGIATLTVTVRLAGSLAGTTSLTLAPKLPPTASIVTCTDMPGRTAFAYDSGTASSS